MEPRIIIDNKIYNCNNIICNGSGILPSLIKEYGNYSAKCPHNWLNNTLGGWLNDPSAPTVNNPKKSLLQGVITN